VLKPPLKKKFTINLQIYLNLGSNNLKFFHFIFPFLIIKVSMEMAIKEILLTQMLDAEKILLIELPFY